MFMLNICIIILKYNSLYVNCYFIIIIVRKRNLDETSPGTSTENQPKKPSKITRYLTILIIDIDMF